MNQNDEKIWKYLDGQSTPEEKAEMERLLAGDESLRQAFLERKRLDEGLRKTEAEQPSMRFVMNLMERLPALYKRAIEPLVRPVWIKAFFATLSLGLISYFGFVFYALKTGQIEAGGKTSSFVERMLAPLAGLPSQTLAVVAALSLGYLGLVLLDRGLKKVLLEKKEVKRPV